MWPNSSRKAVTRRSNPAWRQDAGPFRRRIPDCPPERRGGANLAAKLPERNRAIEGAIGEALEEGVGVGPSSLAEGVAVSVDEVLGEAPRGEDALAVDPREHPPELGRLAIKGLPPLPFPNRGRVETVQLVEQRVHLGQPLCVPGLERGGVPEIR